MVKKKVTVYISKLLAAQVRLVECVSIVSANNVRLKSIRQ